MATSTTKTDTGRYPVWASKSDMMTDLDHIIRGGGLDLERLRELQYRLENTDTSAWADPTARNDD